MFALIQRQNYYFILQNYFILTKISNKYPFSMATQLYSPILLRIRYCKDTIFLYNH